MMVERIFVLVQRVLRKDLLLFVVGFFLGWWVMGWLIWPVQWTDAAPAHLHRDYQMDYLRMAIDSYRVNRNAGLAQQRFQALGEAARPLLDEIMANPGPQSPEDIQAFALVVTGAEAQQNAAEVQQVQGRSPIAMLGVVVVLLVLAALGAGGVGFLVWRMRQAGRKRRARERAKQERAEEAFAQAVAEEGETPLRHQVLTYRLGDDYFDESFAIETEAGEFLGECGINLSEALNPSGSPKQAAAFEIWLFDKNDIQTVTKVLIPPEAPPELQRQVQDKGDLVPARPGDRISLETAHLRVEVHLREVEITEGPQGPYFTRLVTEFLVWHKETAPTTGANDHPQMV